MPFNHFCLFIVGSNWFWTWSQSFSIIVSNNLEWSRNVRSRRRNIIHWFTILLLIIRLLKIRNLKYFQICYLALFDLGIALWLCHLPFFVIYRKGTLLQGLRCYFCSSHFLFVWFRILHVDCEIVFPLWWNISKCLWLVRVVFVNPSGMYSAFDLIGKILVTYHFEDH